MTKRASRVAPLKRLDVKRLMKLADSAPPAQRSPLRPFIGVVVTLRNKGYSYEKIADFLSKHTRQEFTRSQVFSFVKRNSNLFGFIDRDVEDAEGEPIPSQLVLEHTEAVMDAAPFDIPKNARFLNGDEVKDPLTPPDVDGWVKGELFFNYRIRQEADSFVPEWWDGKKWSVITTGSIRSMKSLVGDRKMGLPKQFDWQA